MRTLAMFYIPDEVVKQFDLPSSAAVVTQRTIDHIQRERGRSFDVYDILQSVHSDLVYVGQDEDNSLLLLSRYTQYEYAVVVIRDAIVRSMFVMEKEVALWRLHNGKLMEFSDMFTAQAASL